MHQIKLCHALILKPGMHQLKIGTILEPGLCRLKLCQTPILEPGMHQLKLWYAPILEPSSSKWNQVCTRSNYVMLLF